MPPQLQTDALSPTSVQSPRGQNSSRSLFTLHGVDVSLVTGQASRRPIEELLTALRKVSPSVCHTEARPLIQRMCLVLRLKVWCLSWAVGHGLGLHTGMLGVHQCNPRQAKLHLKAGAWCPSLQASPSLLYDC